MPTSPRVIDVRPPTPDELDALSTFSTISFAVAVLAFLCVVVAASLVAAKTRLPGRYGVLASIILLPIWFIFEQSMGGSLEMTFGPAALLVAVIVYALFATLFSISFVRMCVNFLRHAPTSHNDG
jgi:F0F1-type ATP synthase membrane subunit a